MGIEDPAAGTKFAPNRAAAPKGADSETTPHKVISPTPNRRGSKEGPPIQKRKGGQLMIPRRGNSIALVPVVACMDLRE